MTPIQREILRLKEIDGYTLKEIAAQLGISVKTADKRLQRAREAKKRLDPAVREAQQAVGTNLNPKLVWAKTKDDEGNSYSVLLKPEQHRDEPEDIIDRIAERLNNIQPAPFIKRPKIPAQNLRNFLPLFDVHLSMRVGDYGTAQAVQRLTDGSEDILSRLPSAECTIVLNGGDFTHQDDPSNLTPQSKHPLPVDMEYDDTTDVATDVTVAIIERALTVSDHVIYQPLRGNHDPNTARILRAALRQRYRKNDRVTIQSDSIHFFAHRWGRNMLLAHHGDVKANQQKDLALNFSARYRDQLAGVICAELFVGHLHSILAIDLPGFLVNRLRAISPKDRHSEEGLWEAVSEMIGICYRESGGRHTIIPHYFG